MVHRAVRRRTARVRAADSGQPFAAARAGERLFRSRCAGHQGHRAHHQPRCEGRGVLAQGAVRRHARVARGQRVRALRVHQRGHQQHQPRADAASRARRGDAARARPHHRVDDGAGARPGRSAHAQPHPRPDRQPDHAGQGSRQRGGAAAHRPRTDRRRATAGQDERRGGQLQRAPGGLPRCRLGGFQPQRGRAAAGSELQPVHHPDRAARLHGRAVRCHHAQQHHPHRLVARRVELHQPGLFQAAVERWRDRQQHHAAQGQPDRLRERRGQLRSGQCAAHAPEPEAADQPHAARPHRQHCAAQHGRGAGLRAAGR